MSTELKWENYADLFRNSKNVGDHRPRLLLHVLWEHACMMRQSRGDVGAYGDNDIKLTDLFYDRLPHFHSENFEGGVSGVKNMHNEWEIFAKDLRCILNDNIQPTETNRLKIYNRIRGKHTTGAFATLKDREDAFVSAVMNLFVATEVKDSSGQVTEVIFKPNNLKALIVADGSDYSKLIQICETRRIPANEKFSYNLSKFVNNVMLAARHTVTAVNDGTFDTATIEQNILRDLSGNLVKRGSDGKCVKIGHGSDEWKKLTIHDKCKSTGIKTNTLNGCTSYLLNCLNGNGVEQCKKYLKEGRYFDELYDIKNINPALAIDTLRAFQIPTVRKHDSVAGRELVKAQNWTEWLAELSKVTGDESNKKLKPAEYTAIVANTKLQAYVNALVNHVNANPAILNPDYRTGKCEESGAYNLSALASSRLGRMGIGAIPVSWTASSQVERMRSTIGQYRTGIALNLAIPNVVGLNMPVVLSMRGGGSYENFEAKLNNPQLNTAHALSAMWGNFKKELEAKGKSFATQDSASVDQHLERLVQSETKLNTLGLYARKYADLVSVYGVTDPSGVLSWDTLKKFVDEHNRYFSKVARRQDNIMSVLQKVADVVDKETKVSVNHDALRN